MKQNAPKHLPTSIALAALTLVAAAAVPTSAPAQRAPRVTQRVALMRICMGEAGQRRITPDCSAFFHLLGRRAIRLRTNWLSMARRYSGGDITPGGGPRLWLGDIWPHCRKPFGWYHPDPNWRISAIGQRACRRVRAHVDAILAGRVPDPCHGLADHWGHSNRGWGRQYREFESRWADPGWQLLDCGATVNAFWYLPQLHGGRRLSGSSLRMPPPRPTRAQQAARRRARRRARATRESARSGRPR